MSHGFGPLVRMPTRRRGSCAAPGDVIPEDPKSATAPVAEGYWEEQARREIEHMEMVAAENRSKFLDPHGLRTKADFWDKDE
jgi:hypothetical protein